MTINWQETLTPIAQVLILAAVPIILELLTGVGNMISVWIRTKTQNVIVLRFMTDIACVVMSLKQQFTDQWKKDLADGKITKAEFDSNIRGIQLKAKEEIAKLIAAYPTELTGYLKTMADHYLETTILKLANPTPTSEIGKTEISEPPCSEEELANTEAVPSK